MSKLKITDMGGVDCQYYAQEVTSDAILPNEYHVKSQRIPHPTLTEALKSLEPILASVFGFNYLIPLLETSAFSATEQQIKLAKDYAKVEQENKLKAVAITLQGTQAIKKCIITGEWKMAGGLKAVVNTPKIDIYGDTFGFESILEQVAEVLENEVYEYLFNGKSAQLTIFDAIEQAEKEKYEVIQDDVTTPQPSTDIIEELF